MAVVATDRPLPPDVSELDRDQRERRDRIVAAAVDALLHVDHDAIQMKAVTASAGVALRTTYRYFASKDHLLGEALVAWAQGFPPPPADGRHRSVDQLTRVFRLAVRAFEPHPNAYRTMAILQASTDPHATRSFAAFAAHQVAAFESALPHLAPARRTGVVAVMSAVLDGSLRSWSVGRASIDDVYRSIDDAADLLLGP